MTPISHAPRSRPERTRTSSAAPALVPLEADHARVLQQFRVILNAVKTHYRKVERTVGVGGTQVWALAVIRDRPGIGINDLAAALHIQQPTASILVRNLVQQALIEARRESSDRRAVQLYVTPEAHNVLLRAPGPAVGLLPDAIAALDSATLRNLERDLGLLIDGLGADRAAANVPLAQL